MPTKKVVTKTDKPKTSIKGKEWTIMIYLAGDNNLSVDMAYALRDVQETLRKETQRINLLVYYDNSCLNSPTMYCDFSDAENPLSIPAATYKNFQSPRRFRTSGVNQNAATMSSLYQFVDWCVGKGNGRRNRRASKYALIVSGHGSGFQNLSFLKDDRSDYYMTIPKFRETLAWIKKDIFNDRPINLVGFDNCVMGMIEIGDEIKDFAKVMVASEGYVPNAGWSYSRIIRDSLKEKAKLNEQELAKGIVQSFIRNQADYAIGGVSVDMAAWDLSKVGPVSESVNSLGELLYRSMFDSDAREVLKPLLLQAHYECQSYMFEQNVDLKDFCAILAEQSQRIPPDIKIQLKAAKGKANFGLQSEVIKRCKAAVSAVEKCILLGGFSGGKYQYSNGISIFFPWTASIYENSSYNYRKLSFAKKEASYWDQFLEIYLEAISRRQSKPRSNPVKGFVPSQKNLGFDMDLLTELSDGLTDRVVKMVGTTGISKSMMELVPDLGHRVEGNPRDRVEGNPRDRVEVNPRDRVEGNPRDRGRR